MTKKPQGNAAAVQVNGKTLQCTACGHGAFYKSQAQLNTAAATFFNMDWVNPTATLHICDRCGFVHWFYWDPAETG